MRALGTTTIIVLLLGEALAAAAPKGRDPAAEARIEAELRVRSVPAVDFFRKATAALDANNLPVAVRGYREVLDLAPGFAPALRRLSYATDEPQAALTAAREALAAEDRPENQEAVVRALLRQKQDTYGARREAAELASKLLDRAPDELVNNLVAAQAGIAAPDKALLERAVVALRRLEPHGMPTHYFSGIAAAMNKDWIVAEDEILKAKQGGLPAEEADRLLAMGIHSEARTWRYVYWALYSAAAWAAGLVLLLVLGLILSRVTLAAVSHASPRATGEPSGAMKAIRKLYALVLGLTSIYFYISIPFVLLLVVAGGGGLLYAFWVIGRIPVKLVALIAIVVLVTIWAMLKSLFIRRRDEDPGELLPEEKAPRLFAMLRDVASRVGTRPVDVVYLVPDAAVAVFERGSFVKRISGRSQRVLILGLGVLEGMTQTQLKAILAHEYGHFSNKDTAGGGLALHVRRSVLATAEALAHGGAAAWYNPAWLFLNGFYRVYLRVSQGASRLQEVLADRWAALCYGARAFVDGLRHVIRRSVAFELLANQEIGQALRAERPLANLYALHAEEGSPTLGSSGAADGAELQTAAPPVTPESIEKALQAALEEPASAYDSHPAPAQRIGWVERLEGTPQLVDDGAPAWDLVDEREKLQLSMTEVINARVQEAILYQRAAAAAETGQAA